MNGDLESILDKRTFATAVVGDAPELEELTEWYNKISIPTDETRPAPDA